VRGRISSMSNLSDPLLRLPSEPNWRGNYRSSKEVRKTLTTRKLMKRKAAKSQVIGTTGRTKDTLRSRERPCKRSGKNKERLNSSMERRKRKRSLRRREPREETCLMTMLPRTTSAASTPSKKIRVLRVWMAANHE